MPKNRNIPLMYLIALLQGMVFYAPIASLYRQAAGLTLAQIALIESISYLFSLGLELPWGILADRIGCRCSMIASCAIYALSKLVFWRAQGFGAFLAERFVLSIALAGLSGVEETLLYLSCPKSESQRTFARQAACCTAGQLLAAGAYTLFIGDHYRIAALATLAAYALAALLSLGLQEVQPPHRAAAPLLPQLLHLLAKRRFLAALAGFALFREGVQLAAVWLSQNQLLRCGMGSAGMGAAYMLITVASLGGAASQHLTDRLGPHRFTALCLTGASLCCAALILSRSAPLSIACICIAALSAALLGPLFTAICAGHTRDGSRAAMLSLFALVQSPFAAAANAGVGRIADLSLNGALALCALLCLCGLPLLRCLPPRLDKTIPGTL